MQLRGSCFTAKEGGGQDATRSAMGGAYSGAKWRSLSPFGWMTLKWWGGLLNWMKRNDQI